MARKAVIITMNIQDHHPGLILFAVILILAIYLATRKVNLSDNKEDNNLKEEKETEKLNIKLKSTPVYDENAERKTRAKRTKQEKKN